MVDKTRLSSKKRLAFLGGGGGWPTKPSAALHPPPQIPFLSPKPLAQNESGAASSQLRFTAVPTQTDHDSRGSEANGFHIFCHSRTFLAKDTKGLTHWPPPAHQTRARDQ